MKKDIIKSKHKWNTSFLAVICLLLFFQFSFIAQAKIWTTSEFQDLTADGNAAAKEPSFSIAVASDLHLNPNVEHQGGVNPLTIYNREIIDALLWDVQQQNVDVLLLCGDITNDGRQLQHELLLEKLEHARAQGLTILALPGNHDINETDTEQFAKLYQDFGYNDAYSRDTDSLSYSFDIKDHLFLMLDTDGYTDRTGGPALSDSTLDWVEQQLKKASENHWKVIAAGHFPILTAQLREFAGRDRLIELFEKYEMPLYICGHLHQRGVVVSDDLVELVVDQAISYPCSYARIDQIALTSEAIQSLKQTVEADEKVPEGSSVYCYTPQQINVSAWASENTSKEENLLNFTAYEENLFQEKSRETIQTLAKNHDLSDEEFEQAVEFYRQMQLDAMNGFLCYTQYDLMKTPGYEVFLKITKDTNYEWWLPMFFESTVPYTGGFFST